MLKGVISEIQMAPLINTREQIQKVDIQLKGTTPQLKYNVRALNHLNMGKSMGQWCIYYLIVNF
jgi:hypothetical protein